MNTRIHTLFAAILLIVLCNRIQADPISNWTQDSMGGFALHLSGNLATDSNGIGQLWSGELLSPTGDWAINYGGGSVRQGFDDSTVFRASMITGRSLSPDLDLRFSTGGGYSCFQEGLPDGSGDGWAMIMGDDNEGWEGSTYITFTAASNLLDFNTWQWEADVYLRRPQADDNVRVVPENGTSSLFFLIMGCPVLFLLKRSFIFARAVR